MIWLSNGALVLRLAWGNKHRYSRQSTRDIAKEGPSICILSIIATEAKKLKKNVSDSLFHEYVAV